MTSREVEAFEDLLAAARIVCSKTPCSDPDCCSTAVEFEAARRTLAASVLAVDQERKEAEKVRRRRRS